MLQYQPETKESQTRNRNLYWIYDALEDEFYYNLTYDEVADLTGCDKIGVLKMAEANVFYKKRYMFFKDTGRSVSELLTWFNLPPRIKIEALQPLRKAWGEKIYNAYYNKYKQHRNILILNAQGDIVKEFRRCKDAVEYLGISYTTVTGRLRQATQLVRTKPQICYVEDYEIIKQKYYSNYINHIDMNNEEFSDGIRYSREVIEEAPSQLERPVRITFNENWGLI